MNILYYIPNLSQDWGGVRQYAKGVLEIIAKDKNNRYFIYHNNDDAEILKVLSCNPHLTLLRDSDVFLPLPPSKNKRKFIKHWNLLSQLLHVGKQIVIVSPNFIDALCDQFSIDIIHCPYQDIPKTEKVKLITTLHDVQELHFPEFFSPQERADRALCYMDYLFRADKVIVSYDHVKADLIKYFQISENKIDILLINMNDLWISHFSEDDIIDVKDISNGNEFLLYPANTWKHKNHLNLVQAIALLRDKYNIRIKVICTGDKNEHFECIDNLIKELNLEEQITFTGIVSEQVLYSLYKACKAIIIPSLYEAGSFPLYESILLNVPVICSNVTSLPETINNEDCLFNPFNVENIASKIKDLWTDENFRNRIEENLKNAIEKINLNNPLLILQNIYLSLMNHSSASHEVLNQAFE
jgi:glycosyltransferase involved in cell wall biosynthesis